MLTTLVVLGLVAVGAAHETAMALVVDGAVIAVVSMMPLEPGDEEGPVRRRPPVIASVHA